MATPNSSNFNQGKHADRKRFGKKYTNFLASVLNARAQTDVSTEIVFSENSHVDFVWRDLSLGMECKRFENTKYVNMAWLAKNVVQRFIDYHVNTGIVLTAKILCVTERKWERKEEIWLVNQGFYIIETGPIDTVSQRNNAELIFFEKFTDVLLDIANKALNPRHL
jgi:hypothetical protein